MATTCTVSISSDIAPGFGGISESMTLTQAGSLVDIDSTTGFSIRKLSATAAVDLITMASELVEPKDSVAAKIYIRNIGYRGVIDKSVGVTIGVNSEPIGKLYGGDWMKCQKQMVSELIQSPGFHPESWESEWFETNELRSY